jgi:hypothetical protein
MFLLDTNVFVQAKNRYYAFDICPGFWEWLDHIVDIGGVGSVILVRDELLNYQDELAEWIKARQDQHWFLSVEDTETQSNFSAVAQFVNDGDYKSAAKADFLNGADPWLISKAMTIGGGVVTEEVYAPEVKRKVPIPNVCEQFNVPYKGTFSLLRELEATFVAQFKAA